MFRFYAAISILLFSNSLQAMCNEVNRDRMIKDLEFIHHVFKCQYAPLEWKKSHINLDIDEEFEKAKQKINASSNLSVKEFQRIANSYVRSTRDFHVKLNFVSTESASLPFTVKRIANQCYISSINTERIPADVFAISIGDEILEFDGKPISEVFSTMDSIDENSRTLSEKAFVDLRLTLRIGSDGDIVPNGPIKIKLKSGKTGSITTYQFIWEYFPEKMIYPENDQLINKVAKRRPCFFLEGPMLSPWADLLLDDENINKGFLPPLGDVLDIVDTKTFYSYIYKNSEDKLIGYIRIPSYKHSSEDMEEFEAVVSAFQEFSDALIIDQTTNPGGSALSLYTMLSMLTDRPLKTPKHRIALNPVNVFEGIRDLEFLEYINTQKIAEAFFGWEGFPVSLQMVHFFKSYLRFIIDQWGSGKILSDPIHIIGIDEINPHPTCRYTKPILILINELDLSAGDFFPAIMQDNKRALIMGTQTGGAGGYVKHLQFPNQSGIDSMTYTASIAVRDSKNPIENLGVKPDIDYKITVEDLRNNYGPYCEKINEVINTLLR